MEHTKYSKVSPKKVKAWSQNNRKSMSGPLFWRAFEPASLPRDALETMLGWNPEKPQRYHFFGTLFLDLFWTHFHGFFYTFFVMFFVTSFLPTFSSLGNPRAPIWGPFGYQVDHNLNKSGKIKTAFSLESGHQNQAFQGLCFATFHICLISIVETHDVYTPSNAQFALYSISWPIWHPIWDPNSQ